MPIIQKAPETMTAKERVQRTFAFEPTDRVTVGYEANPEIHKKLCAALGVKPNDTDALYAALGVDYRGLVPDYTGPDLFADLRANVGPDRHVDPLLGCVTRWVEHGNGGYWDYCDFPLADADDEAFAAFPVPNPDHFDYDGALEQAKAWSKTYAIHAANPGVGDVINSDGMLMGMEDALCHLALGNEAAIDFIDRRSNYNLGVQERLLDKCGKYIDFMWLGEDLGTQIAPIISLELYRKYIKPIHRRFIALAESYNLPTIIHTCGSSSWAYEDMIESGMRGVDTLQPEALNMDPAYLVKHFGGRLTFRGCISTAGPLTYGTAAEVEQICRETLEIMMPVRGYHFAPTHAIQDNTPVENVIAMYQAAHTFGRY